MTKTLRSVFIAAALAALTGGSRTDAAGGVTSATITDPVVQTEAFDVRIPAGWKFQGTVFPGPPCNEIPYPVYRAYSPDGLTEMRKFPRFDWTFDSVKLGPPPQNSCLPLDRKLTAEQFVRYFAGVIGATYVGPMSVAPKFRASNAAAVANMKQNSANIPGFEATGDTAAIRVRSKNGSFVIEQRLRAWAACTSRSWFRNSTHSGCYAVVDVLRAPSGKLDALARDVDANNLNASVARMDWQMKIAQILQARGNARIAALIQHNNDVMRAQQERFEQSMAVQQHDHEQFLAQMQSSTNSSMNATGAAMNARSTAASDWVDYALDQQTVTGSGGTVKISNAYSQTWANGQGQWYQTNDPNANPNGVLYGNWTPQTRVHGNGTPQ